MIIECLQDLDAETSTQFNLQICALKAENARLMDSLADQQTLETEVFYCADSDTCNCS